MSIRLFLAVIVSVHLTWPGPFKTVPGIAKPAGTWRNAVLIGWDGADRYWVRRMLDKGRLPNLHALAKEGSLVAIDAIRQTDTKAGWAQILTGYEPETTGVFSNRRYRTIPPGLTIFERFEKKHGPARGVTGAIIGKDGYVAADPPVRIRINEGDVLQANPETNMTVGRIVVEEGVTYQVIPGRPYYHAGQSMDLFENGLIEDDRVAIRALYVLRTYRDRPFFLFVHFGRIDDRGHGFGEGSKEYLDAMASADAWLGRIVAKLRELKIYGRTLVVVTADHGFDRRLTCHDDAPYVFMAANAPGIARRGRRYDVAATIYELLGFGPTELTPPLDGRSLLRDFPLPPW